MRRSLFLLTIPALTLLACGRQTSGAAFASQADSVCRASNGPAAGLPMPTSRQALARTAGDLRSATEAPIGRLRKLEAPGDAVKTQADAAWGSFTSLSEAARALELAATNGDDVTVTRTVNDTTSRFQDASTKAAALGLKVCVVGLKNTIDLLAGGARVLVRTSYLARGDTICEATATKLKTLPDPSTQSPTKTGRSLDAYIAILDSSAAELSGLTAPPGDEATVAEMNDIRQKFVVKLREARAAAVANRPGKLLGLNQELDDLDKLAGAKQHSYGFETCGRF